MPKIYKPKMKNLMKKTINYRIKKKEVKSKFNNKIIFQNL